jgi:hypothetical protein
LAWASEDSAAFDSSYKQAGKFAAQVAQRYDGALRQTVVRLAEVARQDASDLSRNPLAIETARGQWPLVTYVQNGDKVSLIPGGRALLSSGELDEVAGRKFRLFLKGSTVLVAAPAGGDRTTVAEIPLAAFTDPLAGASLGDGTAVLLLDEQGRSLGRKSLASEEQELLKSVDTEAATTLVSKTSVLSLARIPTAGWTVIVRLPLAEAYRGIALPELDERTLPNPLYIVKREQGVSLEGVGKALLFSFGGLALLALALLIVRRRLRGDGKLGPLSAVQSGGLAVLEALVGEKNQSASPERRMEDVPRLPAPVRPPAPPSTHANVQLPLDGATSGVWRDTLQAQVSYLLGEFRQTQEQMQGFARQPQVDALQAQMEAEFDSFAEALRQRLELESRHYEALKAQQAHLAEVNDGKFGMLESEIEGYRNQGLQADRQANERIQVLAQAVQQLHASLTQSQQENAKLREELGALSARVHRIVQLLAKGKTA